MAVKHGLLPIQLKEGSGLLKTEFGGQFVDQFMIPKMQLEKKI